MNSKSKLITDAIDMKVVNNYLETKHKKNTSSMTGGKQEGNLDGRKKSVNRDSN